MYKAPFKMCGRREHIKLYIIKIILLLYCYYIVIYNVILKQLLLNILWKNIPLFFNLQYTISFFIPTKKLMSDVYIPNSFCTADRKPMKRSRET